MLETLHPRLGQWVHRRLGSLTPAQEQALPHILAGQSVLLSSPTGSGKTLAAFLGVLDHLLRLHLDHALQDGIYAIYISPLRALTYDIQKNLLPPLKGIKMEEEIRVGLRTGDTTQAERAKIKRRPPHILLTTPESLAILLAQPSYREALSHCRYVIVDELHALAENKRGAHLTLSLERLPSRPIRIGLTATAAPLEMLGQWLVGMEGHCQVVEAKIQRRTRVEVLSPLRRDPYPPAGFTAHRVLQDIARLVAAKQSTIIFCNTRSGTESISLRLKNALPKLASKIEAHHASLDRDLRLDVEDRLKRGQLRAVVCSTSLELGIDIGSVDCVIMISTPKGISRALQRIGRSGHNLKQESHGILVATNVNDLMECIVCAEMTRHLRLDAIRVMEQPLDVLAQHLVGMAMQGGFSVEDAWSLVRRAYPFRDLNRAEFERVVNYLEGGGRSLEKQYRANFGKIVVVDDFLAVPSKKVEREYLANVGVIHTEGMVTVYLGKRKLGQVEESFMKRVKIGDIFVLAGRIVKLIETGVGEATVEDASGRLPTVPTWNANKMPLASGLAREVALLRSELAERLAAVSSPEDTVSISDWLVERFTISSTNADAIVKHAGHQLQVSQIPTAQNFLIERFLESPDENQRGGRGRHEDGEDLLHFFFHSLIGRSANDALSRIIAYRVKEAVGGNAMVTIDDYGFLLTLKPFQDLELEAWKELFVLENAEADLRAALKESDLVKWNFRGVAQTGLMVPRNRSGEERRVKQLRWSAEILFRVLAEHEPDHPLLLQSYREATHVFLDLPRAMDFLAQMSQLDWRLVEVPVVTPFSFGLYATKIKEGMMLEDPEEAIERLWREFERKTAHRDPSV